MSNPELCNIVGSKQKFRLYYAYAVSQPRSIKVGACLVSFSITSLDPLDSFDSLESLDSLDSLVVRVEC